MRRISRAMFWKSVREWPDQAATKEVLAVFASLAGPGEFTAFDEFERYCVERLIPASCAAAHMNECHCADTSVRAYLEQTVALIRELTNGDLDQALGSASPTDNYPSRARKLSRSWARRRMCHPTESKHFVCYCDEHTHP